MSFQTRIREVPCLPDYATAQHHYATTRPLRLEGDRDSRPLAGRRQRLSLRPDTDHTTNTPTMVARMYALDIITWHADGRLTLLSYPSRSTEGVVNALLAGTGIRVRYQGSLADLVQVEGVVWRCATHAITLRPTHEAPHEAAHEAPHEAAHEAAPEAAGPRWTLISPTHPLPHYTIDRAASRHAIAPVSWRAFMDNVWARWALLPPHDGGRVVPTVIRAQVREALRPSIDPSVWHRWRTWLRTPSHWPHLIASLGGYFGADPAGWTAQWTQVARQTVPGVVRRTPVPSVPVEGLARLRAADRAYAECYAHARLRANGWVD